METLRIRFLWDCLSEFAELCLARVNGFRASQASGELATQGGGGRIRDLKLQSP